MSISNLQSPASYFAGSSQISDLHLQSPISNLDLWGRRVRGGIDVLPRGCSFPFTPSSGSPPSFRAILHISSRRTRSLGAFGAKSTSPSPARDLEVPMSAAQDLYLQLKISEFCERCCVWKISDRHLRSPLNKSTGVPQRSRCMAARTAVSGGGT